MAGLDPAIHVLAFRGSKNVDARHKAGHDERVVRERQDFLRRPQSQFLNFQGLSFHGVNVSIRHASSRSDR